MTSDGINDLHWAQVETLASEVAHHSGQGRSEQASDAQQRLLHYLDELEACYGRRGSILATRADYVDDLGKRLQILQEAHALAVATNDASNRTYISSSLAQILIEDAGDYRAGRQWLSELADSLAAYWDDFEHQEYLRLKEMIRQRQADPFVTGFFRACIAQLWRM